MALEHPNGVAWRVPEDRHRVWRKKSASESGALHMRPRGEIRA